MMMCLLEEMINGFSAIVAINGEDCQLMSLFYPHGRVEITNGIQKGRFYWIFILISVLYILRTVVSICCRSSCCAPDEIGDKELQDLLLSAGTKTFPYRDGFLILTHSAPALL